MPDLEAYVLNTGRVGGEGDGSKKVRISDSSAIVQGIVEDTIRWHADQDFGYDVASSIPGVADLDLLQPRHFYRTQGRLEEYQSIVARLKKERVEYLSAYQALDPAVLGGLGA
jgi:ATP-dependent phosphoenolpyruvate carboxykinase